MADSLPLGLTWGVFWLHLLGERQAARRTGRPRGRIERRRAWCFYAGLATIAIALVSPIETLSKELLWVHMIEHVMLLTVAAPLIVLGAPWMSLWRPLPLGMRRTLAKTYTRSPALAPLRGGAHAAGSPAGALILYSANLVFWHLPAQYDLTLRNTTVHAFEHLSFVGFGVLLFSQVITSPPLRPKLGYPGRIGLLVAALLPNIGISMVLAFSHSPIYSFYAHLTHRPGGISALADQQIAAGIMWSAGDIPFAIAIALLVQRMLSPAPAAQELLAGESVTRPV